MACTLQSRFKWRGLEASKYNVSTDKSDEPHLKTQAKLLCVSNFHATACEENLD